MKTSINQISEALQAKNVQFTIEGEKYGSPLFGVNLGKSVWHWFVTDGASVLWFDHSYSCNTGTTKKGIRHSLNIYRLIEKITGLAII